MGVWRVREDPDGTRHYWAPRGGFDMTDHRFSVTREQRKHVNRFMGRLNLVAALLLIAGAWVGHHVGHTTSAAVFGALILLTAGCFLYMFAYAFVMFGVAVRDIRRETKATR